jgi:tRNA dimethylallyltransferase
VIAGPTATGKTGTAVELARRLGGELVGADSVQVYRGFDVGSAKPTAEELRGMPHHLVDVLDPDEAIDAVGYAVLADRAVEEVAGRGGLPVVVGGTGLWLRALVRGLVDVPPVDPALRSRLEAEAQAEGAPALHARLAAVDHRGAERIHPNDRVRIVRALEVFEQTGRPLGELRAQHALGEPRYRVLFTVIDLPNEALGGRIEQRTRAMIGAGWADEARRLLERWGPSVRAFGSVGYREMLEHVRDGVSLEETEQRIVRATRTYARRQRTWFRSEPGVDWRTDAHELVSEEGLARVVAWHRGS